VEVLNLTDRPVQLLGSVANCPCRVLTELPVVIPAKGSQTVAIDVPLTGQPGVFMRTATLLVEDDGLRRVSFRMTGRILAPTEVVSKAHP
jgi:hypothetical protein